MRTSGLYILAIFPNFAALGSNLPFYLNTVIIVELTLFFPMQLLKHKCPVNGVNKHGNTPLHYACFWNSEECAEVCVG